VRELNKSLRQHGFASGEIHGDMDQSSRIAELDLFKAGKINILVASDVAARGLDITGVSHVFNFDTPWHPDDYVHRIGRTGRAGAKGRAFTLVTPEDTEAIANVEKLTGTVIPVFELGAGTGEAEARPAAPSSRESRGRKPGKPPRENRTREPSEAEEALARSERSKPRNPERRKEPAREREPALEEAGESGEWNGPVPGFLGLSAL
jgi:superfamily II DNA/RNA helicase